MATPNFEVDFVEEYGNTFEQLKKENNRVVGEWLLKMEKTIDNYSRFKMAKQLLSDYYVLEEPQIVFLLNLLADAQFVKKEGPNEFRVIYTNSHSSWKDPGPSSKGVSIERAIKFKNPGALGDEADLTDFKTFLSERVHFISAVPVFDMAFSVDGIPLHWSNESKKQEFFKILCDNNFYPFIDKNTGQSEMYIIQCYMSAFSKSNLSINQIEIFLFCIRNQLRGNTLKFWTLYNAVYPPEEQDEFEKSHLELLGTNRSWLKYIYDVHTLDRVFAGESDEEGKLDTSMGVYKIDSSEISDMHIEKTRLSEILWEQYTHNKALLLVFIDDSCQVRKNVSPGAENLDPRLPDTQESTVFQSQAQSQAQSQLYNLESYEQSQFQSQLYNLEKSGVDKIETGDETISFPLETIDELGPYVLPAAGDLSKDKKRTFEGAVAASEEGAVEEGAGAGAEAGGSEPPLAKARFPDQPGGSKNRKTHKKRKSKRPKSSKKRTKNRTKKHKNPK